ncbi:hypothetical protein ACGFW5_33835 [Streptomyces sp. NPDC048416]|uniref:hypothetical protein n=1 Tax=Streptomyces sp. NPDC048416 TaxID=3365546 RepID=UPI003722E13B
MEFAWAGTGVFDARVACCVAATLHPGQDGGCQLVFRFQMGAEHGAAPVVLRVDVPPAQSGDAEEFMRALWSAYEIPDRPAEDTGAHHLARCPREAGWILSPAAPASEELFQLVMDRVNADDI